MGGKTPRKAYDNYLDPLHEALRCITLQRLTQRVRSKLQLGQDYAIALNGMDPVPLKGIIRLTLTVGQTFQIVENHNPEDPSGPYRVHVISYFYQIARPNAETGAMLAKPATKDEILTFHWTPDDRRSGVRTFPHLHIGPALIEGQQTIRSGDFHNAHIPTGRVSLEAVIRLLIEELGVKPRREDWASVLSRTESAFLRWKTR